MARTLGEGGWSWFGDPRAVHFAGRHSKTYVGWVDRQGAITVASFDHRARHVERFVLRHGLSIDDHNSPGLLMGPDAHLTVYYMGPGRAHMYYRRARQPEDVSSWGPEHALPTNTPGNRGYTYPNPIRLADEQATYLLWRGGEWWPAFSRRPDGGEWSDARTILRIPGQRPYLKLDSDGRGVIHIAYTEGNPGSFVNSVHYLRYQDGAFHRSDGTRVAAIADLPLSPSAGERVYDARPSGVRAWVWDVAARPDGRPVIVYSLLRSGTECSYERAELVGDEWIRRPIVDPGGTIFFNYAPGISLDHENPDVAYLSRKVGGRFVVQRWRTEDRGETWTHRTIDGGAAGSDCLRPITPRGRGGAGDVVWMQGDYRHYRDYRTDIRALFADD